MQVILVGLLGLALGWHPQGDPLLALLLIVLGIASFGGLSLLLAGGIAIPLDKYPHGVAQVLQFLPSAALSNGLHRVLEDGAGVPLHDLLTLLVWATVALPAAARWFRWE